MKIGDLTRIGKRTWICTNRIENAVFLTDVDDNEQMIVDARSFTFGKVW